MTVLWTYGVAVQWELSGPSWRLCDYIYTHRSRVGDVIVKSNFYSCLTFFYTLLNQLWICYLRSYKKMFCTSTAIRNWKTMRKWCTATWLSLAFFGNPKETMIVFFTSIKDNISICLDSVVLGLMVLDIKAQRLSRLRLQGEVFTQTWYFLYKKTIQM